MIFQKSAFLASEEGVQLSMHFRKKLGSGFFGGEGFIMQKISGQGIVFAEFDGHVIEYELQAGQQIVIDTGHLAAMSASCNMDIQSVPGVKNMLFGGEGFVLQKYTGQGQAFLELDGTIVEKELAPGEKIKVDTGNIAFFEARVGYSAEMVKGFANILFGGEGLFLSTLTGPGKVWLQTMSASELARRIIPFIPSGGSSN